MKKILILMLLLIAVTTMFGQVNLNNNQLKLEADGDVVIEGSLTVNGTINGLSQSVFEQGLSWNEVTSTFTRLGSISSYSSTYSNKPLSNVPNAMLPIQDGMRRCVVTDAGAVAYYLDAANSINKDGVTYTSTGTTDATTADKLVDSAADFVTDGVSAGMVIYNTTDGTYAVVTAVDDLNTLSVSNDVFVSGEGYQIGSAILNGDAGQVMVEIPEHWWYYTYSSNTHYWYISGTQRVNWNHFEKSYIGAYEAQIYDDSAGSIIGGSTSITVAAADNLCSISGTTAHTNETRAEYRTLASQRGTGWHQMDNSIYAAVTRLMIIEYANFDFQIKISTGLTDVVSGDWSAYNGYSPLHNAGLTNSLGNVTGEVALEIENFVGGSSTLTTQVPSYRGIENPYGHFWKFLDGINVHNSTANGSRCYVSDTPANYADNTDTNYDLAGSLAEADGYGLTLMPTGKGFYPASVGASSTTGLCDYYYTEFDTVPDGGWRVVLAGGDAAAGAYSGVFSVFSHYASSYDGAKLGARLCAKF